MSEFNFARDDELRHARAGQHIREVARQQQQQRQRMARRSADALPGSGPGCPAGLPAANTGGGQGLTSRARTEDPPVHVPTEGGPGATAETIEDRCKAEWNKNSGLRSEFANFQQYSAYMKAAEEGRVRIFGRAETYGPRSRRKSTRPEGPSAATLITRWKSSPGLRAEFRDDFLRFAAFQTAAARGLTPARE